MGVNGTAGSGGAGGAGLTSTIAGRVIKYAGGGGGGAYTGVPGAGGTGGGGRGGPNQRDAPTAGKVNSGGGGGGSASGSGVSPVSGAAGGSGIVVLRYEMATTPPYLVTNPLVLADCRSGSTELTNTNRARIAEFPVPAGYGECQLTTNGSPALINAEAWIPAASVPAIAKLHHPPTDGDAVLYAWFTNTAANVPLLRSEGRIGYATEKGLVFTNTSSVVDLGKPAVLQIPSGNPFTIECRARFNSFATSFDGLYSRNNPNRGSTYSYMLGIRNSGKIMTAHAGSGGYLANLWRDIVLPAPLSAGRWYHLAYSFDGSNMRYYLDGALVGTLPYDFVNDPAHAVTIGGYDSGSDIDGSIAEMRVWNHGRSGDDIRANATRRLSGREEGLLGYWPMAEGTGPLVYDWTANATTGTVIGARWTVAPPPGMASPPDTFSYARGFTLADPDTGSTRFTGSNRVDLAVVPVPAGSGLFQITTADDPAGVLPENWAPVSELPASLSFSRPAADQRLLWHIWFADSATTGVWQRAEGSIFYTTSAPVPAIRSTLTRERLPGQNVIVTGPDLDTGSTGGTADGTALEIFSIKAVAGRPEDDLTPGDAHVTLATEGEYPLLLWLENEAGNAAASAATCLVSVVSYSGSNVWTGLGSSDVWHDGANWSAGVPVEGQKVIVKSGSLRITDSSAALGSLYLGPGVTLTFEGWETVLEAVDTVIDGTITHAAQTVTDPTPEGEWTPQHRIWLKGSNLTVTASGRLDADRKGYRTGAGPGRGRVGGYDNGGGGGYGGRGGDGFAGSTGGAANGDSADPWQPGSGGGFRATSTPAGGAIRVELSGGITVDGTITACAKDGTATHDSASSGGGIAIYCGTFEGAATGLISANGGRGNYYGGSGGGGRIAIHYNPISQAALATPRPPVRFSTYAWLTSISGTTRYEHTVKAQMGTLYLPDMTLLTTSPTAPCKLGDQRFWYTRLCIGDNFNHWAPQSLVISNCAIGLPVGFKLDVGTDLTLAGTVSPLVGETWERASLTLYASATNDLYGSRLIVGRDMRIGSDTWIYPHTEGYSAAVVGIKVGGDVAIAAGGGVNADDRGYMPKSDNLNGAGAGTSNDTGGSYGGRGGGIDTIIPRAPYGLAALPLEPGSPGGWRAWSGETNEGRGGGAIHLLAGGDILLDGLLTANGGRGWFYRGPGGSGGAIFLAGRRVSGSGELRANGGAGEGARGPGGGGRIAVWHHMPLAIVEQRIAKRDISGLAYSPASSSFKGKMYVEVTPSTLTRQPERGTTGFYSLAGTVMLLR